MSTTASHPASIETLNPATGERLETYRSHDRETLERRLDEAVAAADRWATTTMEERATRLRDAAKLLRARKPELAELATREMGKPIAEAEAEVEKCAVACGWFADNGARLLADQQIESSATQSYVAFRPLGVLLAIMPWNFPYWQVFRAAAPALMAGNVVVLKHAANVTGCALRIEEIFRACGLTNGEFATILVGSREMDPIVLDDRIAAVTLTGSEGAGSAVGASAGKAIKKTVLELGGSDYFIVLADADLEKAAEIGVKSRFQNTGQSCIAAKRFIVHEQVADEFERLFAQKLEALTVGDPMDDGTKVGPLATESGREDVEELVKDAVDKGARVVTGGQRPDRAGWYYPPTLIADITPQMRMHREEVFGPVASLYRVPDLDAAIELANDTEFGLGSNIWTDDPAEQQRFVRDVEAGMVFVNGMTTSYPELPFGGVKASGYGRELTELGMREFMNIKTVWIGADSNAQAADGASTSRAE